MPYPSLVTFPGDGLFPGVDDGVPALFTPPQRTQRVVMEGALTYSFPVSQTVWKDSGGAWHSQEVPYMGDLVDALFVFQSPEFVDSGTAGELIAAGIGTVT